MIDDPIVIRKARGALIVSSTNPTDPIQLIRQVSKTELEVHLKNGSKYIEDISGVDMNEVILEMMGYVVFEVTLSADIWPEGHEGGLKFVTGKELQLAGADAMDFVFTETPYLRSKFLHAELSKTQMERTYYEYKYLIYDVDIKIKFHGRIDMKAEIQDAFWDRAATIAKLFAAGKTTYGGRPCASSTNIIIREIE